MINAIKSWFFDKINNIDKTSANLKGGAEMRERKDSNKIRIEREDIATDTKKPKIIRDYCEQLYTNKLDQLEEMGKFLETHNPLWLKHVQI